MKELLHMWIWDLMNYNTTNEYIFVRKIQSVHVDWIEHNTFLKDQFYSVYNAFWIMCNMFWMF